jgi:hypothetical protein
MENFKYIEFHKTRDFSDKVNATTEFITQNAKSLGKSLLLIAGPPLVAVALLRWSFFADFDLKTITGGGTDALRSLLLNPSFWVQIVVLGLFFIVSSVATTATINNYLILYERKRSNQINPSEVWAMVLETFWMYLSSNILFWILLVVAYVVMVMLLVLFALVSPALMVIAALIILPAFLYAAVGCIFIFLIRGYEGIGFFEALIRSFTIIQGKWWSTFGLTMVLFIIAFILSLAVAIPGYIISHITSLHDFEFTKLTEPDSSSGIPGMISFTVSYLGQAIIYSFPAIGLAFQYFNLVERKEGTGLMSQLQMIGTSSAMPASDPEEDF